MLRFLTYLGLLILYPSLKKPPFVRNNFPFQQIKSDKNECIETINQSQGIEIKIKLSGGTITYKKRSRSLTGLFAFCLWLLVGRLEHTGGGH